jgi:hypothetical protein
MIIKRLVYGLVFILAINPTIGQTLNRRMQAEGPTLNANKVNPEAQRAYLHVRSEVPNLRFDSNWKIDRVVPTGTADWDVWLAAGTHMLKINADGFELLEIPAYSYGGHRSYELSVTVETGSRGDLIPTSIVVSPADASVSVDGQKIDVKTPYATRIGKHVIKIDRSGYRSVIDTVSVSMTKSLFNYSLVQIFPSKVSISSSPSGALILVDNVDKGKTNKDVFLFPGTHRLQIIKNGHEQVTRTLEVGETDMVLPPILLTKSTGRFRYSVDPPDANVAINREAAAPGGESDLSPGRYTIEIRREGFRDTVDVVEVAMGQDILREYRLTPRFGSFQFSVQPLEARSVLRRDGSEVMQWVGGNLFRSLSVGMYDLETSLSGYDAISKQVQIKEGNITVEDVTMKEASQVFPALEQPTVVMQGHRIPGRFGIGAGYWFGSYVSGPSVHMWYEIGLGEVGGLEFDASYNTSTSSSGFYSESYSILGIAAGLRLHLLRGSVADLCFGAKIGYEHWQGSVSMPSNFYNFGAYNAASDDGTVIPLLGIDLHLGSLILRTDLQYSVVLSGGDGTGAVIVSLGF